MAGNAINNSFVNRAATRVNIFSRIDTRETFFDDGFGFIPASNVGYYETAEGRPFLMNNAGYIGGLVRIEVQSWNVQATSEALRSGRAFSRRS